MQQRFKRLKIKATKMTDRQREAVVKTLKIVNGKEISDKTLTVLALNYFVEQTKR